MDYRKAITDAITRARKTGWKIVRGEWLDTMFDRRCCCPMTALLLGPEGEAPRSESFTALKKKAAKKLGVSEECVDHFIKGFDGDHTREVLAADLLCRGTAHNFRAKYIRFFDLGVEFRRRLRPRYHERV